MSGKKNRKKRRDQRERIRKNILSNMDAVLPLIPDSAWEEARRQYPPMSDERWESLKGHLAKLAVNAYIAKQDGVTVEDNDAPADVRRNARELSEEYARKEYTEPTVRRMCWGMFLPEIDEPTGAALHLAGAMAALDYVGVTGNADTNKRVRTAMSHIEDATDILWPESDGKGERVDAVTKDVGFGPFKNFPIIEPTGGADALNEVLADVELTRRYVEDGADAETVGACLDTVKSHVMRAFDCLWNVEPFPEDNKGNLRLLGEEDNDDEE